MISNQCHPGDRVILSSCSLPGTEQPSRKPSPQSSDLDIISRGRHLVQWSEHTWQNESIYSSAG